MEVTLARRAAAASLYAQLWLMGVFSRGAYHGYKPSVDLCEVQRLRIAEALGATEIARLLGLPARWCSAPWPLMRGRGNAIPVYSPLQLNATAPSLYKV
jgi:hypothetical protein